MSNDTACIHEWEFVSSDYEQIDNNSGYVESFECIHCNAKMKQLYVFLKEEVYNEWTIYLLYLRIPPVM